MLPQYIDTQIKLVIPVGITIAKIKPVMVSVSLAKQYDPHPMPIKAL